MPSKLTSLCVVALLLLSLTATSARPLPSSSSSDANPMKIQHELRDVDQVEKDMMEESCDGVGEEECLMRRALTAHIDYIYTQKHNP